MTRRYTTAEQRQRAKLRRAAFWNERLGAEEQPDLRMARAFDLLRTRLRQYEKRAMRYAQTARTRRDEEAAEQLVTTVYEIFGRTCERVTEVLEREAADIDDRTAHMARTLSRRKRATPARRSSARDSAMHEPPPDGEINVQPSRPREATTDRPDGTP